MKTLSRKRVRKEIYSEDEEYIPENIEEDVESLRKTDRKAYDNFIETKLEILKT